jgi:hypothetical protein
MWLEAILTRTDLESFVRDLCPLHLRIGDGGNVLLTDPRDVHLAPGAGLELTVSAEIHWPVLGLSVPIHVRSTTVEVRLSAPANGGQNLSLAVRMEELDVQRLPKIADKSLVDHVNDALAEWGRKLCWEYGKTLQYAFKLPYSVASASAIDLTSTWARVRVTSEAVVVAMSFRAEVILRGLVAEGVAPAPPSARAARPLANTARPATAPAWSRLGAAVAVAGTLAIPLVYLAVRAYKGAAWGRPLSTLRVHLAPVLS